MLAHVTVRNLALIDEADVDFEEGLNVLTGETGAGKSILLGAMSLALSGKGGKEMIRDTSQSAGVDLLFLEERPSVLSFLSEQGIDVENGEILVSRRFNKSGRGMSMINGVSCSASQIKALSDRLIDIHGQHEHQSLLNRARHIELLDRFIPEMKQLLPEMKKAYEEAEEIRSELSHYQENGRDRVRLLELMDFEIREIEETAWQEGEEEQLSEERKKLLYAEKIKAASLEAQALLSEDSAEGPSAESKVDSAAFALRSVEEYDTEFFSPYVSALQDQLAVLEDTASSLRRYAENLEDDPERLNDIEERLQKIDHLKQKYGNSVKEVNAYLEKTRTEKEKLDHIEETIHHLQERLSEAEKKQQDVSGRMSVKRKEAASRIEKQITKVLGTLQFDDPLFQIRIEPKEVGPKGADDVSFMIRTNVGEEVKPLSKIASGGEMSRVMLAIKTVLAEEDDIATMIFDEIDTGISGRTAQSVAEKMSHIAAYHQVICVTHLPQIAAMADCHLRIEKGPEKGRTVTRVEHLEGEAVTEELSRMLGGARITDAVRDNAVEMKKLAEEWKGRRTRLSEEA